MASGPGPRQIFLQRIIALAWAAGGGLAVFSFKWNEGYDENTDPPNAGATTPPGTPQVTMNFGGSTVQIPNFNIFGGRNDIVPDALDPIEKKKSVSVKNPLTPEMLLHYAAWTPFLGETKTITGKSNTGEFWVIDLAQWILVYDAHETSRQTGVMSKEAALNEFKSLIGSTGYEGLDPDKMGVKIATIFYQGRLQDPPSPPSQEGWAVWTDLANYGWAGHMEQGTPVNAYGKQSLAYWIINLGLIKKMMATNKQKDKSFKFTIEMPNPKSPNVIDWEFRADTVKIEKDYQKKFDVQTTPKKDAGFIKIDKPIAPQVAKGKNPKAGGTILVEVFFSTTDPQTKQKVPPRIQFTNNVDGGGGAR